MSTITNYKTHVFSGPTKSIVSATTGSTDYLDIKWIGSTGIQYIVTDIVPKPTYNIRVVGQKLEADKALFGVGGGYYSLTGNASGNYFYVGFDDATSSTRQHVTCSDQSAIHTWGITNKIGYCDSNIAGSVYSAEETTENLAFFGRNWQGTVSDLGKGTIYEAQIWDENGSLIGNFVPKIQLSTGKPGLYDTVNSVFYSNNGTGEFTYEIDNYQTLLRIGNNPYENYKCLIYEGA